MKIRIVRKVMICTASMAVILYSCKSADTSSDYEKWLTTADRSLLFENVTGLTTKNTSGKQAVITIDQARSYQEIDGFGYTLTGGSAMHLYKMEASARRSILEELFSKSGRYIGVSYLRVSLGASDLDERVFSYCDTENGMPDPSLSTFSLACDTLYLVPVLKEIVSISPRLKILASPWSPPVWMKTNQSTIGGSLKEEYQASYAQYFVKYIQAMAAEGIRIDAVTVQNEPLHPGNNPSLLMLPEQQTEFIREDLGPAFEVAGIDTKIIIYDHNADRIDYPLAVLADPEARKYIDGSAFHLYGGTIDALSEVHQAYPEKHIYFTEQWIGAPGNFAGDLKWHVQNLIIGATRNWCRTVLEWNLAADPNQEPHTDNGGCTRCLGALTIDGNDIVRNPAYYIIAHASKFVRPGSVRIDTDSHEPLPNVAFRTPEGGIVLIVLNSGEDKLGFEIRIDDRHYTDQLDPGSVATYIF